jgi:hypothetical protein
MGNVKSFAKFSGTKQGPRRRNGSVGKKTKKKQKAPRKKQPWTCDWATAAGRPPARRCLLSVGALRWRRAPTDQVGSTLLFPSLPFTSCCAEPSSQTLAYLSQLYSDLMELHTIHSAY